MKAVILAAGVGSRLDPLTTQLPKPLVPIANRPVLEHLLSLVNRSGITEVYSNLHYLPDGILNYFNGNCPLPHKPIFQVEKELTGDAGGVRIFRHLLADGTFLVMMGDLVTDIDLAQLIAEHKRKKALATIALKRVDDPSQFGVAVQDTEGFITGFEEKPPAHQALSNLASTGIYVLEPEIFEHIPASGAYGFGRQLFPDLLAKDLPVLGVEINGYWSDSGTIKQYQLSNFDALEGKVGIDLPGKRVMLGAHPAWIDDNSSIAASCRIEGSLMLGKNCIIGPGVEIHGKVIIGDNCLVEPEAYLQDTILWSNTRIQTGAHLVSSIVGNGCTVSSATRMRQDVLVPSATR